MDGTSQFTYLIKLVCHNFLHNFIIQAKGNDAATTTGTEAAIYASEASDKNDLLDEILPATVSDFVSLVKVHLSAGEMMLLVIRSYPIRLSNCMA